MPATVDVPEDLSRRHARSPGGRAWLDALPGLIDQALQRWKLTVDLPPDGAPGHGHAGIVVPVRRGDGTPAALKISFPYEGAVIEPLSLSLWNGHGMVAILEQDQATCSMLLARLNARKSLIDVPMEEAVNVWGGLVRQLSIAPDARAGWTRIPHIADAAERYCDELPARWNDLNRPFPRWLLEAALEVCQTRGAVSRRESCDVLVHTDLHYLNILASLDNSGYLGIDPQPQLGGAEFAVAPCLWNRLEDLPRRNAEAGLRRRCSALAAAAGLDADLAAAWAVVREVENALWYLETPHHIGDAQRSLWVAGTMAGRPLPGLPAAHDLKALD